MNAPLAFANARGQELALAVVEASASPLLLLDEHLAVVVASRSFRAAFLAADAPVPQGSIFALGAGEWNVPQLRTLLVATVAGCAAVEAYEMDLRPAGRSARRLVINAQRVEADAGRSNLLLSIADVTDARAAEKVKDDLLREKAILLQELQHRVANSLQIIASILLQSARTVDSAETRLHLRDAHQRVMSIAAVQRQLTTSTLGEVSLRDYFTDLCGSISASMIHDHSQLSLEVRADDTSTATDIAVSLGLVVTELVINALKHAFPEHRARRIWVDYASDGPEWRLSVRDDGVGMPVETSKPGLGTSIVEALAKQLDARVEVRNACPGTEVTLTRTR